MPSLTVWGILILYSSLTTVITRSRRYLPSNVSKTYKPLGMKDKKKKGPKEQTSKTQDKKELLSCQSQVKKDMSGKTKEEYE